MLETAILSSVVLVLLRILGVDLAWYAWSSPLLVLAVTVLLAKKAVHTTTKHDNSSA